MDAIEARKICENFAIEHKVIFDDEGECGFGRPCVGFRDGSWIAHNPDKMKPSEWGHDYHPIDDLKCDACLPPEGVDAYHKHDCLAVLGRGDDAITQLAEWVVYMQSQGRVEIVSYETGATGLQAMLSGVVGRAVMVR
jgi:hypothetical protein